MYTMLQFIETIMGLWDIYIDLQSCSIDRSTLMYTMCEQCDA